jgi:iron complex transport system ATP-binding protein
VTVLHDLTLASRWCDRLLLIDEGRLMAEGAPAEVLTAERIGAVYHVSAFLGQADGQPLIVPLAHR